MPQRSVWTLGEADITVYAEDGNGNLVLVDGQPVPLVQYCFVEDMTIRASTEIKRRAVTGRGARMITTPSGSYDDCSAMIEHMFFRKATEINLTNIFNPGASLRLVISFFKLIYTNVAPFENDTIYLSCCKAKSFEITGKQPEIVMATANFEAELVV